MIFLPGDLIIDNSTKQIALINKTQILYCGCVYSWNDQRFYSVIMNEKEDRYQIQYSIYEIPGNEISYNAWHNNNTLKLYKRGALFEYLKEKWGFRRLE